MPSHQDQLTFVGDKVLLFVSSLGLICVATAVLWVVRQSPGWARMGVNQHQAEDDVGEGEGALLGTRTRVVPGGREATKAARKEAKRKAKAEFKESKQSSGARAQRTRLQRKRQDEQRATATDEGIRAEKSREGAANVSRRLEQHILNNKVSLFENLETELGISPLEIGVKIAEMERKGSCTGVVVDNVGASKTYARVSLDEMRSIASFVEGRGRLTLGELASETDRILGLSDPIEVCCGQDSASNAAIEMYAATDAPRQQCFDPLATCGEDEPGQEPPGSSGHDRREPLTSREKHLLERPVSDEAEHTLR